MTILAGSDGKLIVPKMQNAKMSLVTGIISVVADVISAVCAVCTNSHSAGLASSAIAELLKNSPVIKAVANVSMVFMFVIYSLYE